LNFFDAHGLTGKDLTEIKFLATQTDAPAIRWFPWPSCVKTRVRGGSRSMDCPPLQRL
jgi:hypothetical protein